MTEESEISKILRAAPGKSASLAPSSSLSHFFAKLLEALKDAPRRVLIVTPTAHEALSLVDAVRFFAPWASVRFLPDWETLPYDRISPHRELVSERIEILNDLAGERSIQCVIASSVTAAQRLSPVSFYAGTRFSFKKGQKVDRERLRARLVDSGYDAVSSVVAPGEFSVRGSIVDIYPAGAQVPFRLDFFDDEIDSIASFDPETQRSIAHTPEIEVLPGREFPTDEKSLASFRTRWRSRFEGDPSRFALYRDAGNGLLDPGIEYYLPLFFDRTAVLTDFFGTSDLVFTTGDALGELSRFMKETRQRCAFLKAGGGQALLEPEEIFETDAQLLESFQKFASFKIQEAPAELPAVRIDRKKKDPAGDLARALDTARTEGKRLLIVLPSQGRVEIVREMLYRNGIILPVFENLEGFIQSGKSAGITQGLLIRGTQAGSLICITEAELFDKKAESIRRRKESQANVELMIRDLSELNIGDPVVHVNHGIGRYAGLVTMNSGGQPAEFVRIDYAGDAKLYLPVTQLQLLSRYSGADPEHAPLHHLGKGDWDKARRKAAQKIRDTAAELLNLYSARKSQGGLSMKADPAEYERFASGFAFEETPDQENAIEAVLADMAKPLPMDRLICGDVGFGKTEVALRAAFVAAMSGRQVAVLCPTTLLAEQHYNTFTERFSSWPVSIAGLSRFRSAKVTEKTIEGIADGTVDIVIGTHKLLTPKMKFKRLGLIIIDEEHRFGVRQKEFLKTLRAQTDVLTLTATPIPRTLAMSLEGIRDFSVITTAPEKRLSIKTFVRRESPMLIREAVMREAKRGGQIYFLHNDVSTIENRKLELQKLLPEVTIGVAHGQMPERELERVMRDFYNRRYTLLLCSSIIENGIDIANANTIIIHRADKFGLAQLHQLRGRVGRSRHQAYAYLLIPGEDAITPQAVKRLEAIQNLQDLGSGFYLSMHDMEIRGAGEVLGEHQSGEIEEIGYDLYNRMLSAAVKSLKNGKEADLDAPFAAMTEINLHAPALLPSDYIEDVHKRLSFYKELAGCETFSGIEAIRETLGDRYGKLPEAARTLIEVHRVRIYCEALGIDRIDATDKEIHIAFSPKPKINTSKLISLIQKNRFMRFGTDRVLKIQIPSPDIEARLSNLSHILKELDS